MVKISSRKRHDSVVLQSQAFNCRRQPAVCAHNCCVCMCGIDVSCVTLLPQFAVGEKESQGGPEMRRLEGDGQRKVCGSFPQKFVNKNR